MLFLSVVALRSCINLRCILHSAAPPTYIRPLSMRIHPAGRAAQATLKTQNFSHQDRRLSQLFMTWRSSIFLFLMGSQETYSIFIANANIAFYTLHLQSHTLQSLLYTIIPLHLPILKIPAIYLGCNCNAARTDSAYNIQLLSHIQPNGHIRPLKLLLYATFFLPPSV